MSTKNGNGTALEDFKVPVKLKLSILWTSVMFCYIYGDIFTLQVPGHLDKLIAGTLWNGGPLTQGLLLSFAVYMTIPILMVFLSLTLKPAINRWTNVVVGSLCTIPPLLIVWGSWYFYILITVVETVLTALIVWYAWKWPRKLPAPHQ
jgi:hypothetical protein